MEDADFREKLRVENYEEYRKYKKQLKKLAFDNAEIELGLKEPDKIDFTLKENKFFVPSCDKKENNFSDIINAGKVAE